MPMRPEDVQEIPDATITVERLEERFRPGDLDELCFATEEGIEQGLGFNWLKNPPREVLEAYWKGVLVVPNRTLFVARLGGTIAGAIQLVRPTKSQELTAFGASVDKHFVAPFARGHGLAKALLHAAEAEAMKHGHRVVFLSVRATQAAALHLYETQGYHCWGVNPRYEQVDGEYLTGHSFFKDLL